MNFFSKCASWLWNGTKRAVNIVWNKAIKPMARKVLAWFGMAPAAAERGFVAVETMAARVVTVLETNVGVLVKAALHELDQWVHGWLREHLNGLATVAGAILARILRLLGSDRRGATDVRVEVVDPTIEVAPTATNHRVTLHVEN